MNLEKIQQDYPLHYCVLLGKIGLKIFCEGMENYKPQIEKLDNYNRTPLKLAVMMGNREAAFELLRHGAKPDGMDAEGFSLYHYAILSRDVHLIAEMYRQREMSRLKLILSEIGKRFANFSKVPDFYYELKWEITGIPGLSPFIANDTYKIYKKGSMLRVDSKLISLKESKAFLYSRIYGDRSFIFIASENGATEFIDMDHSEHKYSKVHFDAYSKSLRYAINFTEGMAELRIRRAVKLLRIYFDEVKLRKVKEILRMNRKQVRKYVEGYKAKAWEIKNINVENVIFKSGGVSKTPNIPPPLENIISYFSASTPLAQKAADLIVERTYHTEKRGRVSRVYMCEDTKYPYTLKDHLEPVLGLLSLVNPSYQNLLNLVGLSFFANADANFWHGADVRTDQADAKKLKGVPLIMEIPIYFLLKARITVQNIAAKGVDGVTAKNDEDTGHWTVEVKDQLFKIPSGYEEIL